MHSASWLNGYDTLPVSQCPLFVIVEMGVTPNARARGESVCQKAIFSIKGIPITVLCRRDHKLLALLAFLTSEIMANLTEAHRHYL